jgi:glutamate-ammonia-ligase adenylyltransferase
MGYRGDAVSTFARERAGYTREVRRLHEKLFYRPLLSAVARLPASEARLTPEAAGARLQALGFAQPAVALRHLEALTEGVSRRAAIQQTLLPAMLGWFADAADPDAGLLSFRQVSDALGSTPWYLRLLRDEGTAAERLARLLASSRYIADLLGRAPEAVRMLASDDELVPRDAALLQSAFTAVARRRDDWEASVAAVRGLRRQELLRVACADVLGLLDVQGVGRALSVVAGATVAAALEVATRKVEAEHRGPLPMRLAVVAMGRLGGQEQGYGSDADVMFVHEPTDVDPADAGDGPGDPAAYAQAVANELRSLLVAPAGDPPLLVDADLRPEGKQGPLVRTLASYAAYYAKWSKVWEAQALLRADAVVGDEGVRERFTALIDPLRYPTDGITGDDVVEVRRIKARIDRERLPRGADPNTHLKLGRGGLADIEWTVQLLQLKYAGHDPALRSPRTLTALDAARAAALISPADGDALERAWRTVSRLRNAITLVTGKSGDQLPRDTREKAAVASILGYGPGRSDEMVNDYLRTTRRARAVVDRVFWE